MGVHLIADRIRPPVPHPGMRHPLRHILRFALDAFARGGNTAQPCLVGRRGPSPGCARTGRATPRHSARSLSRTRNTQPAPAQSPRNTSLAETRINLGLRTAVVWPIHIFPVESCAMPLFLKPLIGFTTSTGLLTSLMVPVSHVG